MAAKNEVFCPENFTSDVLREFNEFADSFKYIYDAKMKPGWKNNATEAEIASWKNVNKRQVFLGLHSSRTMQKIFEEATEAAERDTMTFDTMVTKLQGYFKGNTNTTLANFKFHKLCQHQNESFDAFVLRVKEEAKNCSFSCLSQDCTVKDILIRDQIIIGTSNNDIRKNALKEEWTLKDLVKKGRSLETAVLGAAEIKKEELPEVNRTKPGKYSKKKTNEKERAPEKDKKKREPSKPTYYPRKCRCCSSSRCDGGKLCPGKKVECFACGIKGHYKGAEICKRKFKGKTRKVDRNDSDTEHSTSDTSSSEESPSSEDSLEGTGKLKSNTRRIYKKIPTVRKIAGERKVNIRRSNSKYKVTVTINETPIKVFADTGADVCVMSVKNAKKLKLKIQSTDMKIKPYGSSAKRCLGEYIGTIMYNDAVTNVKIYIIENNVETLLSGPVCEDLGILKFEEQAKIRKVHTSGDKGNLIRQFPEIFSGKVGTLHDHKVKFHIDETVPPVHQHARPVPFHLRGRLRKELKKMEAEDIIEEHDGPAPWVSNLVLAPKDDGGIRVTVDMRQVNKAIKNTNIPIPTAEEIRSEFAGYTVFSKLDFKSAFHQLRLDEPSKLLTVFHAGDKLMRYKRLTMGSTPASGELTQALRPLFQNAQGVHIIHDDVIIAGKDKKEHDKTLTEACERILNAGMTLNADKCIIAQDSIPWWGMRISKHGVLPDPDKVVAVDHLTPPESKDELRSFLCMIQSNKDFIPNISRNTASMRKLMKNNVRFKWDAKCQKEFEDIKKNFREDTLLKHFDPKLKTFIHVDAHISGISAILMQGNTEEDAKVVCKWSELVSV